MIIKDVFHYIILKKKTNGLLLLLYFLNKNIL